MFEVLDLSLRSTRPPAVLLSGRKGNATNSAYSQTAQIFSGLFCIYAEIEYINCLVSGKVFGKYFCMERRCVQKLKIPSMIQDGLFIRDRALLLTKYNIIWYYIPRRQKCHLQLATL